MKLDVTMVSFLKKFYHRFIDRAFIIDLMCQVAPESRNCFVLSNSEYKSLMSQKTVFFKMLEVPEDLHYEAPYSLDELKTHEPKLAACLDDIHAWRAKTGIELMHREPTLAEFIRIFRNWQCMTPAQKEESDKQEAIFQGNDNTNFFETVYYNYYQTRPEKAVKPGDIWYAINQETNEGCFVYVDGWNDWSVLRLNYLHKDTDKRLVGETDEVPIEGMTKLPYEKDVTTTTVGRVLLNYLLAEQPFSQSIFVYRNEPWNISAHHDTLAKWMVASQNPLPVAEFKRYADNFFFIGSFTELCVPAASKKSLTTDPNMKKLKQELYLKNKEKIDAGDPVAIAELESALIAADKAYLKGDSSMRFYGPLGSKPFNIARKKSYLAIGGIEEFTQHGGSYNFINCSLSDGWDPKAIPSITNETRQGSFKRGRQTALGGYGTKLLVRIFQDYAIQTEDCGSPVGIPIDFSIVPIKDFIGRYIKVAGGKWEEITTENMKALDNKKYEMRSPQFCKSRVGLCRKCCGRRFSDLDIKHVGMILAELTSKFTLNALKAMHGTKLSLYQVTTLDQFEV